jgi:hypothetical protein
MASPAPAPNYKTIIALSSGWLAIRPRWIALRESKTRYGWQRGRARGQMQKISAGKFHFD